MAKKVVKKSMPNKIQDRKRVSKKPKKVDLTVRIKQARSDNSMGQATEKKDLSVQAEKIKTEIKEKEIKESAIKKVKQQGRKTQPEKKIKKQPRVVRQVSPEKIEQDKRLMMWVGVAFFMVLIFGAWVFNLKNIFKTTENINTNSSAVQEWDKIADEFTKTLEKVKEGMAELKEETAEEEGRNIFSETATTSDDAVVSEDDEIEKLKKRLEELESKIGEEQATSVPSTQL